MSNLSALRKEYKSLVQKIDHLEEKQRSHSDNYCKAKQERKFSIAENEHEQVKTLRYKIEVQKDFLRSLQEDIQAAEKKEREKKIKTLYALLSNTAASYTKELEDTYYTYANAIKKLAVKGRLINKKIADYNAIAREEGFEIVADPFFQMGGSKMQGTGFTGKIYLPDIKTGASIYPLGGDFDGNETRKLEDEIISELKKEGIDLSQKIEALDYDDDTPVDPEEDAMSEASVTTFPTQQKSNYHVGDGPPAHTPENFEEANMALKIMDGVEE